MRRQSPRATLTDTILPYTTLFRSPAVGNAGIGLCPDAPDDPGVDRRGAGRGLFGLGAGAGIANDSGAQRAHGGDVACAPGHILPEAGLPGALDHHDLETRPQQIAQAADVMRIAGAAENVRGAQITRVDRLFVD